MNRILILIFIKSLFILWAVRSKHWQNHVFPTLCERYIIWKRARQPMTAKTRTLPLPFLPIMLFAGHTSTSKLAQMASIVHKRLPNPNISDCRPHLTHHKTRAFKYIPPTETLSEEHVATAQIVRRLEYPLKRASAVNCTGGVVNIIPSAESPSRDFGSTIFVKWGC